MAWSLHLLVHAPHRKYHENMNDGDVRDRPEGGSDVPPISDEVLWEQATENEAEHAPDPPAGVNPDIRAEVDRQFRLVPGIGTAWRWYDVPYRVLNFLLVRRRYWSKLPVAVRRFVNRTQNRLRVFNHYDREKIAHPNDPLYNLVVPEGESVSLPYFWLVEYYSPSHAEELTRRIGSRKWSRADFTRPESADEAVRQGRERQGSLGWQSIATLVADGSEWTYPGAVRSHLPEEFRAVSLSLLPLGSALTAVVARFDLTSVASESLDAALRADHQPRLLRMKGRLQVQQRMFAAIEDVQIAREALHQAGRDWLARELPGLFAVEAKASHPVVDLLFTQKFDPFQHADRGHEQMNFERALGLNANHFTLIHSREWKRIRIMDYAFETANRESRDAGLVLVARYSHALGRNNEFKYKGEKRSPQGIMIDLDYGVPGLITRYGLFELLHVKQKSVARARDQASTLHSRRPVTSAKKLRAAVLRSSIDMATVARDIESLAQNAYRYEWNVPGLASRRRESERWGKSKKGLLRDWAGRQAEDARRLADLDRELLGILDLASSLNASIEGIRSQRWSLFVALLSLASSAVAVWLAYLALATQHTISGGN